MKKLLLIGGLLGALLWTKGQSPTNVIEYDTVKVLILSYELSLPGNPVCPTRLIKAWEVRAWYIDQPSDDIISEYDCMPLPYMHHSEYLQMNKKDELTEWVFDSKQVNWL
jgi:hypothetical protein